MLKILYMYRRHMYDNRTSLMRERANRRILDSGDSGRTDVDYILNTHTMRSKLDVGYTHNLAVQVCMCTRSSVDRIVCVFKI